VVVLAFVAVFAVVLAVAVVAGDVSAAVAASTLLAFDSEYVPTRACICGRVEPVAADGVCLAAARTAPGLD